jgi:hypothetical protein
MCLGESVTYVLEHSLGQEDRRLTNLIQPNDYWTVSHRSMGSQPKAPGNNCWVGAGDSRVSQKRLIAGRSRAYLQCPGVEMQERQREGKAENHGNSHRAISRNRS